MKSLRTLCAVLALLVCVSAGVVSAQGPAVTLPAGVQRVTSVEGITGTRSRTGCAYCCFPISRNRRSR